MNKMFLFANLLTIIILLSSVNALNIPIYSEKKSDTLSHENNGYLIDIIDDVGWYSSLALDNNGDPHISYYDYSNGDLKYAYFTGTIWNIEIVDSNGNVGRYTSIALDAENNPHISYYDFTNGDLKYAKKTGGNWNIESVDTRKKVGLYTSIAIDSSGNPHISYCDYENRNLKYAHKTGSGWDKAVVDNTGIICVYEYFGDYTSIALDSNDNPHISYCDFENYDLKYAYWTSSSWISETIDTEGEVGHYSSLVLDENDKPHIGYSYLTKGSALKFDLKYAFKTDASWNIETVNSDGDIRKWVSLKLDTNNLPHMNYYDYTKGSLEYTYKDGENWIFDTVESEGSTGCFNSLCLKNNKPHIAYYDWGSKALKYATLNNDIWNVQTIEIDTNKDFLDQEQKYCCGYAYLIDDNKPLAQSFKPTFKVLTRVELMIVKRYTPGSITVSIREDLDGADIATVTHSADEVAEDMAWKHFNFPDIEVNPGETYYIICSTTDVEEYNAYYWYYGINNEYQDGNSWIKSNNWKELTISGFPEVDMGFKTFGLNTNIPSIPEITGSTSGKPGTRYEYSIVSQDGDGDQITYEIHFGDGNIITVDSMPPDNICNISYTWSKRGTYTIKAKAIDEHGAESDWGTLTVTMPKYKYSRNPFLLKLLELFSKIIKILN